MSGSVEPVEWLAHERILAALGAAAAMQLHSLEIEVEVASTQASALARGAPAQGCAVFLAERQSAGQGRLGRHWESPLAANLYLSVARRFDGTAARLSGLSLVVGVAVAEALHALGFNKVGLKWPNDLLADGRKLGGILVQLRGDQMAGTEAVIGVGVNVAMPASTDIDQPWCDLAQLSGAAVSRNHLAACVLDHLLPALQRFDGEGLPAFLGRWQALDALSGKPIRVLDGPREHAGICRGITGTGALRVQGDGGEVLFHSGEISVRAE